MGRNTHRNRNIRGRKMTLSSFPNRGHLLMDENAEYAQNSDRDTYLLSTLADADSLSDRQCYVRSHFVELFISTQADVSTRHSRGAQKLHVGQIGLRCAYCAKLKPRDRAERAICYPSSISRIYQTVADMQRFHFESCVAIPPMVLHTFKSLKTTRPRGVGSPQSYWDRSAREIGLVDTAEGIQVNTEEGSGGKAKIEMQKKSVTTGMLARLDPPGMQNQNQVLMKEEEVELGTSLQVHQHHQATAPARSGPDDQLPLAAVGHDDPGPFSAARGETGARQHDDGLVGRLSQRLVDLDSTTLNVDGVEGRADDALLLGDLEGLEDADSSFLLGFGILLCLGFCLGF